MFHLTYLIKSALIAFRGAFHLLTEIFVIQIFYLIFHSNNFPISLSKKTNDDGDESIINIFANVLPNENNKLISVGNRPGHERNSLTINFTHKYLFTQDGHFMIGSVVIQIFSSE